MGARLSLIRDVILTVAAIVVVGYGFGVLS